MKCRPYAYSIYSELYCRTINAKTKISYYHSGVVISLIMIAKYWLPGHYQTGI